MGYGRYAFALLGGGRGHQRARSRNKYIFVLARFKSVYEVGIKNACAAAAARTACVNVLFLPVVNHLAAVKVLAAYIEVMVLFQQFYKKLAADKAEVARHNVIYQAPCR